MNRQSLRALLALAVGGAGPMSPDFGRNRDTGIPWSGHLAPRRFIAKSGRQSYDAGYRKEPYSISAERLARRRARQQLQASRPAPNRWPW